MRTFILLGLTGAVAVAGCSWNSSTDLDEHFARTPYASGRIATVDGVTTQPADAIDTPASKFPADAQLADYLRCAALNNPGLEAAFARWKSAVERIPQVKALPDPRLSYRYFIEEVETRAGPQRQSVELAQTLPWFGKLSLRGDAAAEAARAEWQQYQSVKLRLFYQVKDAFYEYWYVERAIGITRENVELLNYIETVLQRRYAAAAVGHPEVIRVQVEQGRLADRLRALERFRQPIVARLNAAMNCPPRTVLPSPTTMPEQMAAASDEQLIAWLRECNPQLRALDHEIERQRRLVELAGKEYFPDITLGAGVIDTRESPIRPKPSDSGQDPVYVMLSLNLPIWYEKISAGVREAKWQWLATASRKADLANSLTADLEMALYRYHDALFKIDLYRDALLPKAVQAQQATDAAFRAGRANFTDLIDTQRVLLEFQLALARARADRSQRLAEMEMLVGRAVSCPTPAPAAGFPGNQSTH